MTRREDPRRAALVTGAARGLGRATAVALAESGWAVALLDRSARSDDRTTGVEHVVDELADSGHRALAVVSDLSDDDSRRAAVAEVLEHLGRCDLLVNNAAYAVVGGALELDESRWERALRINTLAPILLCRALVPGMIARGGGRVVNISSAAAVLDVPSQLPYSVGKAGLERYSRGLRWELGRAGVTTVDVVAIQIEEVLITEGNRALVASADESGRSTVRADTPIGRTAPEEFGRAVGWLAEQPPGSTDSVLSLADLRALGGLPGRVEL